MISGQSALQRVLNEAFVEARLRNPAFSLRAFARKVKLPPSAVSEVLNGKRRVSRKIAERVVENLNLAPIERKALLDLFPEKGSEKKDAAWGKSENFLELSQDQFKCLADWYHFAILSLAETEDFRSDAAWISERLNVRVLEIEGALDRLERLGLLRRSAGGKLRATGEQYKSTDEIANLALRRAHVQHLELARESLENDPIEERDFAAMTMAIDPRKLPEAKKMIREFRDRLSQYLESGRKHEVYEVQLALYPLSKKRGRKP